MFNEEKVCEEIIEFIREYYQKNNLKGAVLGISGGKDSAVVAALLVKALGKENVIGLTLPCHSKEKDKINAKLISDYYGFELLNIDLTKIYDDFKLEINKLGNFTKEDTKNSDINIKPRLRMSACYYVAALMTSLTGKTYLVAGTSNKCELYVGYFTKGGDSVHDIAPIADLTTAEVIKIGEVLKVPKEVLYRVPDDGLSNQTDEDKLGVTYKEIADYMYNGKIEDKAKEEKIKTLHKNSEHKFHIPTYKKGN